jgi:DNA polymerase-1
MKGKHKIIDLILRYRELSKLMNTYLEALPLLIEEDGRVHTTFNQTSTSTGRLSTSEPNLQNIPARTKIGREIRKAFVAPSGKKLIVADYSQIELRVIAHLSSDPKMIEAFKKGEDIHTATASLIYNVPLKKVTPKMRRLAKTVNFGVIYGMSSYGLAQTLKISQKQALDFIQKYFSLFKKIKLFQQSLLKKAKEQQFVETLFGRKRFLKNIVSPVSDLQSQAERAAINMPVQGTAADIIKKAMIKLEEGAEKKLASLKMILQIHDELIFEIDKKDAKKGAHFVKNIMENIVKLKVPLKVDINIVNSWGDIKK